MKVCSVDGCHRRHQARGYCARCYAKAKREGRLGPFGVFWSKVDKAYSPAGCWLWTGCLNSKGYGQFNHRAAHRVAYERCIGPIPDGLEIDHVRARGCEHRNCVNPAHLEAVSHWENVMRGDTIAAKRRAQTHCIHGHEFTPENTYIWRGGRSCRACSDRRRKEYVERKQARCA